MATGDTPSDKNQDQTQEISVHKTQQLPRTVAVKQTRRVAIFVAGFLVIIIGVILGLPGVPGPGLLVILGGLTILATEFRWAKRLLLKMKAQFRKLRQRTRKEP